MFNNKNRPHNFHFNRDFLFHFQTMVISAHQFDAHLVIQLDYIDGNFL